MIRRLTLLLAVAVLLALPSLVGSFQLTLLTQGLVLAILALAVWLPLRYLALPSFGIAAFFGVGAYVAGLAVTEWEIDNVFVGFGLAIGASLVVGVPIALVAGRLNEISFLLVTLAFAEMLLALARRWDYVGGSDGLVGVLRPQAGLLPLDLTDTTGFYYFALGMLGVVVLVLWIVVRSPFGGVLVGIRESADRMAALGYNPVAYRVAAIMLSAAIAGAAGVLSAYLNRFVDPNDLSPLVSARALLVAVIGGASLAGPVIAALALTEIEEVLSSLTQRWLGLLGALYVLVALLGLHRVQFGGAIRRLRASVGSVLPGRSDPVEPVEERP